MPPHNKRPAVAPENAATFMLAKHWKDENGRERRQKVKGDPLEDGTVPDQWPAQDFSLPLVLEVFGPGKFRVDFYDANGVHIEGCGTVFEVAAPKTKAPRPKKGSKRAADDELEDELEDEPRRGPRLSALERIARATAGGAGGSLSFADMLAIQAESRRESEERAERAIARERQDATERADRDRAFMGMMMQLANGRASAAPLDMDILRREWALQQREATHAMRTEIRRTFDALPPGEEPEDPDDGDGPESVEDAIQEAGAVILGDLTKKVPGIVNELFEYARRRGWQPSPEAAQALGQAQAVFGGPPAGVNGAPRQ